MTTINHGLYTDTLWAVPVVFTNATGAAVDLSGSDYVLELISNGVVAFRFKSTGGGATDGVIDTSDAAAGQLNFTATEAQHANVAAGSYKAHLYREATDDVWVGTGRALIGEPGAKSTYLEFYEVTAANGVVPLPFEVTISAGGGEGGGIFSGVIDGGSASTNHTSGAKIDLGSAT